LRGIPENTFAKLEGVFNKAPVPGSSVRLIVQDPLVKVEVVSKDELVGFHMEMVVPVGIPYGNRNWRVS
jgi:hypothetical protein